MSDISSPEAKNNMASQTKPLFSVWLEAFRLRTLPLALSSVITGSLVAIADGKFNWIIVLLAMLTTVFLQILSNLANDYGDSAKGTDSHERVGPERTVQSGAISAKQMKIAIVLFAVLSLIAGMDLLYVALRDHLLILLLFFGIGIAAIAAAIQYTVGKHAYGYHGMGDLFVFIFFGPVAVLGTYYLNAQSLNMGLLLPAFALGFLSVGVLNLNNMRDMDNDRVSGKNTFAGSLDYPMARIYHVLLISFAFLFAISYVAIHSHSLWNFLFLLTAPLFFIDILRIFRTPNKAHLDDFLKRLALSTLAFSVLFGIGLLL